MIRQRRRQLWPLLSPRHKRPKLVPIPLSLIRIFPKLLRIRTVVWRIHDKRVGREVVAPPVPEPNAHLARVAWRRGFLDGRPRCLWVRALDGGRREWVVASLCAAGAGAPLGDIRIAHVLRVGRGQGRGRVGTGLGIGESARIGRWAAIAWKPGRRLGRMRAAAVGRRAPFPPTRGRIRRRVCRRRTG